MLDVAIYRRKQEPRTGLRSPDRAMGDGEEEIREDGENGKGETHQRLQPALLLAGGLQLVAGDGERRRLRAAVECERAVRGRGGLGQGG